MAQTHLASPFLLAPGIRPFQAEAWFLELDCLPCLADYPASCLAVEMVALGLVTGDPYSRAALDSDPNCDEPQVVKIGWYAYLPTLLGIVDLVGSSPKEIVIYWVSCE